MAPLQAAPRPEKVSIQLKWKHQFQFAGYYAADHMGYFAAEGLAVQLEEGGPHRDPIRQVTAGKAHYGVGDSDLLVARAQGLPVVVVAAIYQHSPYVLISKAADGIKAPKDLVGKRVMVEFNQGEIQAKAMFLREGIDPSKVIFLPHSWNLRDLIEGRTDAMSGYLGVESYQLERLGIPVTLIRPADHGIDFYGDCLFTTIEEARDHPARVEAVRRAVVKGWTYALDHPEEVSKWILAMPGVQERGLRRENMVLEAEAMHALIHSDIIPVGQITQERWERTLAVYKQLGIVPASLGLEGFLFDPSHWKSARIRNLIIIITLITVAVILLGMAWIFLLRRRIQHSTTALKEREEDYRQLVENTPDCIFVTNGGVFRYLNPAGLQMFEVESGEEILGKPILDFVHPEDRSSLEVSCRRIEDSGICMLPQELRMLGRHGRVTPVEVSATPVRFQGEPAARVLMRDLSEWKRAQADLKASQGILRAFYDGAPMLMGVVEVTPDGEIIGVSVNEAAARSFGRMASEAAGIMARQARMTPEEHEVWLSHYREAEAAGHPIHFVLGGQMRDRTRSLSVTVAPIEKSETGYPRFCFIAEDTTELVRDQERLRLSESRLEEAQRLAHLGSWTWNLATKELIWSEELYRVYGVEPDHHKPSYEDFLARVHPEDRAEVERLVAQAMLDSTPFSHESRIIRPDGEVRTILDQAEVLVDGQGQPTGMAGACLDITDHKRAERTQETLLLISEAAHSAETLPDLFRRIHEIIAGLLPAKNFFVALYDERKDELSFPYFVDELDPQPGVMKLNGGSLSGQVIRTGKALLLTRESRSGVSGQLLPVVGTESMDWVGVPLKSRSRTIGALVLQSYSGDVRYTSKDQALLEFVSGQVAVAIERKQAEQELKDQNELFQMLQRATNDVICDWDLLTDQAKWNDRVTAVFGYPFEEVVAPGTHWWRDRVHPEDLGRVLQSTQEAIEQGESVWSAEYRFQRKDGTYATILDRGYLARDATGKATRLISAMSDLTLRIKAEEAQAANQAKSEFLATMTHELRTPMIGMLGMMEILSHTKLDSDQRSALGTIHSSAQALLGIIGDILDFSKIEAGKLRLEPQVVSLGRIVEEAFTGASAAAADKGLLAKCEIDPGITKAHLADPLRFREIIDNFLSNALKFTRQGSIGIRAELLQTDKESQTLAFRVWDTGIGVSKENQKRLFQPFVQAESTTTRRFGGTGLGLSICLRLAEMMGGGITMESEEGKGTTMSFIAAFPLADSEALEGATQLAALRPMEPPDRETALAAGCLVLLAEDHPTNRLVLTQQLRLSGYQVDTAEDGLAALEALGQTRYGLLLTDIQMPHLDGYQLAKEIRSIEAQTGKPRIPILALTANTMQGELDRCLAVGMEDCIIKPVSIPDLDAKLHCWLPGAAKLMKPRTPEAQPERSSDSTPPSTSSGSPLDLATLDGLSGGDRGTSLDILRDFRDTLRSDRAGLGPLADQGYLPELARLAHRIKGASAMVGAKPLMDAARSLEAHARAGDSHLVAEALAAMETAYEDLERYLAQEIEKG